VCVCVYDRDSLDAAGPWQACLNAVETDETKRDV
jgi:hypothetical protein